MRKLIAPALLAASVLVIGASATMAQNYPDRRQSDAPYAATPRNDGASGERRRQCWAGARRNEPHDRKLTSRPAKGRGAPQHAGRLRLWESPSMSK